MQAVGNRLAARIFDPLLIPEQENIILAYAQYLQIRPQYVCVT